jgi:type VI secretion system protein VasJ
MTAVATEAPAAAPAAEAPAAPQELTFDDLRPRAAAWTVPISEASPGGASAKFDPAYEAITRETTKLDSPLAVPVDWPLVIDKGGDLLKKTSKDLLLAAYLANGLYVTKGLTGLGTGLVLMTDLIDRYWPTMFPEVARIKARVNALNWLLDRVATPFAEAKVGAGDRAEVAALGVVIKRLSEVSREKFGNATPAFGPLLQSVERLRSALPPEAPPTPPPSATAAPAPAAGSAEPAAATSSAPAAPTFTAPAAPAAGGDATEFLRSIGNTLIDAAGPLRQANAADPAPYRMLRAGLYLSVAAAPPATAGKTRVPPLAPAVRTRLDKMVENAKWPEVIDEAESALRQARFCLDLHRYTAVALSGLGDSHKDARLAVIAELAGVLKRMPELPSLTAGDGSPLAGPATRDWIDSEVSTGTGGGGGGGQAAGGAGEDGAKLAEARKLAFGGKLEAALALTQSAIAAAPNGQARFLSRLAMAELAAGAGQQSLARAVFEDLDREMRERGLESWDPKLAARCLEGLLSALRAGTKAAPGVKGSIEPSAVSMIYDRLCRLDPAAALRLGT